MGENTKGFLLVKFKRQRFYNNLLKSQDPLIISAGFHLYQTIPYFARKEEEKMRFLKYTPKWEYCTCVFYGNYLP